jgi:hypothetical protein
MSRYLGSRTTRIPFPSKPHISRGSLEHVAATERTTPIDVAGFSGRRGRGKGNSLRIILGQDRGAAPHAKCNARPLVPLVPFRIRLIARFRFGSPDYRLPVFLGRPYLHSSA